MVQLVYCMTLITTVMAEIQEDAVKDPKQMNSDEKSNHDVDDNNKPEFG